MLTCISIRCLLRRPPELRSVFAMGAAILVLTLGLIVSFSSLALASTAWDDLPGGENPELAQLLDTLVDDNGLVLPYYDLSPDEWAEFIEQLRASWRNDPTALGGCLLAYCLNRTLIIPEDDIDGRTKNEIAGIADTANRLAPNSPVPLHIRAVSLGWSAESVPEMRRLTRDALQLDPLFLPSRLLPVHIAVYMDKDGELAHQLLAPLKDEFPELHILSYLEGEAYKLQGETELAMNAYVQASKLDPNGTLGLAPLFDHAVAEDDDEEVVLLGTQLAAFRNDAPTIFSETARSMLNLDRPTDAWEFIRRGLVHHPDHVDLNYLGGYYQRVYGDEQIAQDYLKHALELNPAHTPTLYEISQGLMGEKEYELAIQYCERILEVDPDHWDARVQILACKINMNQYADVTQPLLDLIEERPEEPFPYLGLAYTYANIGNKNAALNYARQALKLSKEGSKTHESAKRVIADMEDK